MMIRLLAPHVIAGRLWEAKAELSLPPSVRPSPLMEGLDDEARDAIAAAKVAAFGRWVGRPPRLLDDPPIERPIDDPQPVPPIGGGGPPQ